MEREIVKEIGKITTLEKFKGIMNEIILGYPAYLYFGIFESYFGREVAKTVIKFLEEDGIIRIVSPEKEGEPVTYRVTAQGIAFATSMAQLEYSQKMNKFTKIIILFGGSTLFFTVEQIIFILIQLAK